MNDYFRGLSYGVLFDTGLMFPYAQIGLPEVSSYGHKHGSVYTDIAVFDGPARRRWDSQANPMSWEIEFICTRDQAETFERFYRETINEGSDWFQIPLSLSNGMQICIARELGGSSYTMQRIGTEFLYRWSLEGYGGDPFSLPLPPIVPDPPVIPDFIDGGDATGAIAVFIDGGDATSEFTDIISGGNAKL